MTQITNATPLERQLMALVEFHPDTTLASLAKRMRTKIPTVAYHLAKLRERGIIRRSAIVNQAALGFTNFSLYFSLRSYSDSAFARLQTLIQQHKQVVWFGSLAGDFQFGLGYLARHPGEVLSFLEQITTELTLSFLRKEIASRTSLHRFSRAYLARPESARDIISMTRAHESPEADQIDHTILAQLASTDWRSIRQLAQSCNISPSTMERRIEQLQKVRLVYPYYAIDPAQLGVTSYRLLIKTERFEAGIRQKILSFCGKHPSTIMLFESVGPWDYEVDIEAWQPQAVHAFQRELDAALGGAISDIRVLSELEDYKFSFYPL